MKKLIAILLVIATVMALSIASGAATIKGVKKGTPTIDGKFDNLYKDGGFMPVDAAYVDCNKDRNEDPLEAGENIIGVNEGKGYALWDDSAFYFYIVVYDSTPTAGDSISFYFHFGDFFVPTVVLQSGEVDYGAEGGFDESNSHIICGYSEQGGYFFVEAKLVPGASYKGQLQSGLQTGFHWCFNNDINGDGETDNQSTSGFFINEGLVLSGAKATGEGNDDEFFGGNGSDTPVTNDPKTTTKAPDTTKGGDKPKPAPQTSDATLVVGAVALCAVAAAVIIVKKKHD